MINNKISVENPKTTKTVPVKIVTLTYILSYVFDTEMCKGYSFKFGCGVVYTDRGIT